MSIIKTEPLGDRIFLEQFKIIRNLAEEGPCIIIGRGSNKILWDFKSVLHVFIYADMSFRKNHIIETYKLPEQDVEKLIRQADRRRKTYLYEYTNQIWGEPQNYNICIDCGRIGIENTVRIICKLYLGE